MSTPTKTQLRRRFPDWTGHELALYRAGVVAVDNEDFNPDAPHHPCFLRGAADATGADAEYADWFQEITDDWSIDARWWQKGSR